MNNRLINIFVLCAVACLAVACEKEEIIGVDKLPSAATTFLNEHFNAVEVLSVTREKEPLSSTEYEALLDNGVEVKFDKNGNWTEVEARKDTDALPMSFIMTPIVDYVTENYNDAGINGIDKEKNGFDIELTNGLDLVFDNDGQFVRIDP